MQEISPNRFAGIIEANYSPIAGVRDVAERLSFFVGSGLTAKAMRLILPVSLSSILSRKRERRLTSLTSRHEIEIMYFGRTSEFLMMTSERMVIPSGRYTLGQLLCNLYKRGERWAYELDDSHLMCTVNGQQAKLFDPIAPGAEICISSRKSIFEA